MKLSHHWQILLSAVSSDWLWLSGISSGKEGPPKFCSPKFFGLAVEPSNFYSQSMYPTTELRPCTNQTMELVKPQTPRPPWGQIWGSSEPKQDFFPCPSVCFYWGGLNVQRVFSYTPWLLVMSSGCLTTSHIWHWDIALGPLNHLEKIVPLPWTM